MHIHGVVLNELSTGTTLPFFFFLSFFLTPHLGSRSTQQVALRCPAAEF
jgi:hypothetical protein